MLRWSNLGDSDVGVRRWLLEFARKMVWVFLFWRWIMIWLRFEKGKKVLYSGIGVRRWSYLFGDIWICLGDYDGGAVCKVRFWLEV